MNNNEIVKEIINNIAEECKKHVCQFDALNNSVQDQSADTSTNTDNTEDAEDTSELPPEDPSPENEEENNQAVNANVSFVLDHKNKPISKIESMIYYQNKSNPNKIKRRKPYPKEGKQWLINELRSIYSLNDFMKRETYYSLKGEVRHWSLVPVFNYLRKHGYGEIEERFEKYMNSESIVTYIMCIKNKEPVKRISIDIDIIV